MGIRLLRAAVSQAEAAPELGAAAAAQGQEALAVRLQEPAARLRQWRMFQAPTMTSTGYGWMEPEM